MAEDTRVNEFTGKTDKGRISAYLHSLEPCGDSFLNELRDRAVRDDVPIIRRETESFLRTMINIIRPESILEIGTAVGFSAIVMAKASEAKITTLESFDRRIKMAKENFDSSGLGERMDLIEGDAKDSLKALKKEGRKFDLIFLDAAKAQYPVWLEDIICLMEKGSVLIADNVLQDETVTESRFSVPRRERTTHERMREFLYMIKHDERLGSCVLPVGDGVSVSVML